MRQCPVMFKFQWCPTNVILLVGSGWLEGASCCPGALRANREQEADLFECGVCITSCFCPVLSLFVASVSRVVTFIHWAVTSSYK